MANHVHAKRLEDGSWAVCGVRGNVIETHATRHDAERAFATDKTPEERAARLPQRDIAAVNRAYEDMLIARLDAGLVLSKSDKAKAKKLKKERN